MRFSWLPLPLSLVVGCTGAPVRPRGPEYALTHQELVPLEQQNEAYRWLNIAQEAAARDVERAGARPTVSSRQLMIWAVAMYEAWAAYDDTAVGTRLGGSLRRPAAECSVANKNEAIAYASYRALLGVFAADTEWLRDRMRALGHDPDDTSTDPATARGIGNVAAAAVLTHRRHDGSNQDGDEAGSDGTPYSDYTGYRPVNPPDRVVDPDHWQPIPFTQPDGTVVTPGFVTPHWYLVKPMMIESAAQFRAEPPPRTATEDAMLRQQTDAVLAFTEHLTPMQKGMVEFLRDGPRATGPGGHWLRFAQDVSRRDRHDLDRDVKLYFAIAGVAFDALVACWETKRAYDTARPWTLVRHYRAGRTVRGWAGPDGGVREMPGDEWHPYAPYDAVTPPFPGYTSEHACVGGAAAKILELFTGSDEYGAVERRRCCALTESDPGEYVELDLPTFSGTAEMAALSRAMGGYHLPIDSEVGLRIGRELAVWSWPKYRALFDGTATVRR